MLSHAVVRLVAYSVLFSTSLIAQDTNDEVRCDYQSRQVCTKEGCKPLKAPGNYLLVPSVRRLTYAAQLPGGGEVEVRLCDAQGCTPVSMHVSGYPGAFLDLTQTNRGTQYLKLYRLAEVFPLEGYVLGEFIEGEQLFLKSVVGFGRCRFPKE